MDLLFLQTDLLILFHEVVYACIYSVCIHVCMDMCASARACEQLFLGLSPREHYLDCNLVQVNMEENIKRLVWRLHISCSSL